MLSDGEGFQAGKREKNEGRRGESTNPQEIPARTICSFGWINCHNAKFDTVRIDSFCSSPQRRLTAGSSSHLASSYNNFLSETIKSEKSRCFRAWPTSQKKQISPPIYLTLFLSPVPPDPPELLVDLLGAVLMFLLFFCMSFLPLTLCLLVSAVSGVWALGCAFVSALHRNFDMRPILPPGQQVVCFYW